jgi:NADH-quinone oxidoreductase subunit L
MTIPLVILAGCSVLIGFFGTPAWPWLHHYLTGEEGRGGASALLKPEFLLLAFLSTLVVGAGFTAGWYLYRKYSPQDPLEARVPGVFSNFRARLWVDEIFDASIIKFVRFIALSISRIENAFFASISLSVGWATLGFGWFSRLFDNLFIDPGFDRTCRALSDSAHAGRQIQDGRIQNYLRTIALTLTVLVLILVWGCKGV